MKDDCIFCKLANGIIPTRSIYEDENFKVILDAAPATRGHALILPKEHAANLYELPDETAAKAFVLARKLATDMTKKLSCDGFNVVQNNGEIAGQTVFHFHISISVDIRTETVHSQSTKNTICHNDTYPYFPFFHYPLS